jgi:hypothetical protein
MPNYFLYKYFVFQRSFLTTINCYNQDFLYKVQFLKEHFCLTKTVLPKNFYYKSCN